MSRNHNLFLKEIVVFRQVLSYSCKEVMAKDFEMPESS